jgi:hypothetical protein
MSAAAEAAFARRLDQYTTERQLITDGGPLCSIVWSAERSLTATDQVDLIDWLVSDMVPVTVLISPLSADLERSAARDAGCIRADCSDLTLIPLTRLYRCRRISAEMFLQILGGFVRPLVVH